MLRDQLCKYDHSVGWKQYAVAALCNDAKCCKLEQTVCDIMLIGFNMAIQGA